MLYSTSKSSAIWWRTARTSRRWPARIDFTGLIAVLPLGTMGSMTQGVQSGTGPGRTAFATIRRLARQPRPHDNAFFFEGGCELLDAPSEWCYGTRARSLHVWLDSCADPRTLSFRGKVRDYLVNSSHVSPLRLERLTLWGGTLATQQSDLELDTVEMLFPTANRRVLDEVGMLRAETLLRSSRPEAR